MKVRLIVDYVNNDISYLIQVKEASEWISVRSFSARERQMALDYFNDISVVDLNRYDRCSKFPNYILKQNYTE